MNSIGKKISDTRKQKGFTQEDLAELSKVNLRTIQRIESNENEPRGKTLSLICDVLEINTQDLQKLNERSLHKSLSNFIINGVYLILLNFIISGIIGYLALPIEANLNSRIGAFLLCFFIPFFIVHFTQKMNGPERVLKFSLGWIFYLVCHFFIQGIENGLRSGFRTWIFSCIMLYVGVLFYGGLIFKLEKNKK